MFIKGLAVSQRQPIIRGGVEVSSFDEVPMGMVKKTIPANEYVVFTHIGLAVNIGKVHDYLYTNWLDKGADSEESETEVYFPIKERAGKQIQPET